MGGGCALLIANRIFREGRQEGTRGLLQFPIHSRVSGFTGSGSAEIPLPSKSFFNSHTPLAGEGMKETDYYVLDSFTFLVYKIVSTNLQTGWAVLFPFYR